MIHACRAAIACAIALVTWSATGIAGPSERAVRVKRAEIVDANGFERPMVASTIMVPADWQVEGGVFWKTDPCGKGYNFDWRATSPDRSSGIHIFPMEQWQWTSSGMPHPTGCPTVRITSVRDYLDRLVHHARPGARVLDYRQRTDIEQELGQLDQTMPMPMGEIRNWIEAGEVLIAYPENGLDMRETVAVAVLFSVTRLAPMVGVAGRESWSGATLPGYAVRAPDGQLDFRVAEMIRRSIRSGPEWSARIARHQAKIADIQIRGARERARMIAQTGDEIRQIQPDSWRRYDQTSDRLTRERAEAIRGVETYDDPYHGDTVQLDSTYEHAWQLDDGTYVLTDDPSFEPYRVFQMDGRRLAVTQ